MNTATDDAKEKNGLVTDLCIAFSQTLHADGLIVRGFDVFGGAHGKMDTGAIELNTRNSVEH